MLKIFAIVVMALGMPLSGFAAPTVKMLNAGASNKAAKPVVGAVSKSASTAASIGSTAASSARAASSTARFGTIFGKGANVVRNQATGPSANNPAGVGNVDLSGYVTATEFDDLRDIVLNIKNSLDEMTGQTDPETPKDDLADLSGIPGPQGPMGPEGPMGPQGPQGEPGICLCECDKM